MYQGRAGIVYLAIAARTNKKTYKHYITTLMNLEELLLNCHVL